MFGIVVGILYKEKYFCTLVKRVSLTFRYYPNDTSKSSVRPVVPRAFVVLFAEHTSDDPPYVRITNSSVRPLDLEYVRLLRISALVSIF
jgi:hypothetical protein